MPEKPTIITLQDLKQLPIGTQFHTVAAVRHTERKTGKTGTPYLQVEVGDAIDHLNFTCFENQQPFAFFQQPVQRFPHIVQLEGTVDFYNKRLSPTIKSAKSLEGEDYEYYLPKVLEGPDEALEDLKQELQSWIEKIEQKELKATVQQAISDLGSDFFDSVAAVGMHHAYVHGLLEHTVHVTRLVGALLPFYSDINADLALAGAILHDIGKVLEYRYAPEGIERTPIGRLQGHVALGYRLVHDAAVKSKLHPGWQERLEHIILAHQGELEWGAAVLPSSPEAILVSLADNADAKLAMVHTQLKRTVATQPFSEKDPGLNTCLLTQAVPDPDEGR